MQALRLIVHLEKSAQHSEIEQIDCSLPKWKRHWRNMESITHKFTFNGTAEQLLASLDQSIYSTNSQAVKYNAGNLADVANLPSFVIEYNKRAQQQWHGLAVDELLSLFNHCVLEQWEYIGQSPVTPDVIKITLINRENSSNEQIVPPHDYIWQPNQSVFALRLLSQDAVFHLSLLPLGYRLGLSQVIRRIVYRAMRRDIATDMSTTGRYAGVAKQWRNMEFLDALEFELKPTSGGKTPLTIKSHSPFKPLLDRILDSLGDAMSDESTQSSNILTNTTNQTTFHAPVTGPVHTGSGHIYIGDSTTTAEKRAEAAHSQIVQELLENFNKLGLLIQTIQDHTPKRFWDVRRTNETELHYQDRAKNEFRDYLSEISAYLYQTDFSKDVYDGFRRDLAHFNDVASWVKTTYDQQQATLSALQQFETGLRHLLTLNLNDIERTERSTSLHREKVANAYMTFWHAVAHLCLVTEDELDLQILAGTLNISSMNIALQPGQSGYSAAMSLATQYAQKKTDILEQRLQHEFQAAREEIDRRISDPYLVMLREKTGLPPTLTEGEVFALQQAHLDLAEEDPTRLLQLAALSYLEADGHAARLYLGKVAENETLPSLQRQFAQQSLHRLEQPEAYRRSLGIWVVDVTPSGNFEQSGIAIGDVIIAANNEPVHEPLDIASALAKQYTEPVLLTIVRNQQHFIIKVKGREPAGARLTQLIILNAIQI